MSVSPGDDGARPVFVSEPVHPLVEEEAAKRVSLLNALMAEAALMKQVSKTDGLNPVEKSAAKMIALSLDNLVERWRDGAEVTFDEKNLRFKSSRRPPNAA
jgi:hypothetical protein